MTAASLAAPWPLKFAIDRIAERTGAGGFDLDAGRLVAAVRRWPLSVLVIAAVGAVSSYYVDYWLNRAGERIVHALRVATYAQLQRLSLAFHAKRHKGDLVTRVTGDVNAVGNLFADTLGTLASAFLTLVGMFVVCMVLDPLLTVAVFLLAPPLYFVIRHYQRAVKKAARRQRAKDGEIASLATEALTAMPVVKAFGTEQFEHDRVERSSEERLEVGVEAVRLEARFGGLVDMIGAVSTALILALGVRQRRGGPDQRRDPRGLRRLQREALQAAARHRPPVDPVGPDDGAAGADRRDPPLRRGARGTPRPPRRTPAGGRPATSGSRTSRSATARIAGPSATSTSTSRPGRRSRWSVRRGRGSRRSVPWSPASTTRRRDGSASTTATRASARWSGCASRSAYSSRTRSCSAARSGRTSPTAARSPPGGSRSARSWPGATDFIAELPEGLDTLLGPGGTGLSGGQRQRIGIARVLLRDPPVLVLDEPTTGLDAESERRVLDGVFSLMNGRTTLVITHSLSLARSADLVVVMQDGRVVETGQPARPAVPDLRVRHPVVDDAGERGRRAGPPVTGRAAGGRQRAVSRASSSRPSRTAARSGRARYQCRTAPTARSRTTHRVVRSVESGAPAR